MSAAKNSHETAKESVYDKLVDDDYRYNVQMYMIPLVVGCVSFFMFVMNAVTGKTMLMYATLIYALVSFVSALCRYKNFVPMVASYSIFGVSLIVFFTYFMITGGTAAFSPIWICLLASFGQLLLGKKRGFFLSAIMFVIIIWLLWTPFGQSLVMCDYTPEFRMRFPVVYISFFCVGYVFEEIRRLTSTKLKETQAKYQHLSTVDALTQLYNRHYLNEHFAAVLAQNQGSPSQCLVFIADIDDFKKINDQYGHLVGDKVLMAVATIIREHVGEHGCVSRWGGEEFMTVMHIGHNRELLGIPEEIRRAVARVEVAGDAGENIKTAITVGAFLFSYDKSVSQNEILKQADKALYEGKQSGKNRVILYTQDPHPGQGHQAQSS